MKGEGRDQNRRKCQNTYIRDWMNDRVTVVQIRGIPWITYGVVSASAGMTAIFLRSIQAYTWTCRFIADAVGLKMGGALRFLLLPLQEL